MDHQTFVALVALLVTRNTFAGLMMLAMLTAR